MRQGCPGARHRRWSRLPPLRIRRPAPAARTPAPARPGPAAPRPGSRPGSRPRASRPAPSRRHVRDPALRRREGGPLWGRLGSQRALLQLPPPGHQRLGQPVQAATQTGADWPSQESSDRRRSNRRSAEGHDRQVAFRGINRSARRLHPAAD